jgi:hypothetical protein
MQQEKRRQLGNKMDIEDKDILDLWQFNYRNLHESIWNNHRLAWIVTSIFIPVLFAMLGYLVREYDVILKAQVVMGFLVTEVLLIIWLLVMRIFEHYNNVRRAKLKQIENRFNEMIKDLNFSQYNLDYKQKPKEFKFSPMIIYYILFGIYTELNIGLLVVKFLTG